MRLIRAGDIMTLGKSGLLLCAAALLFVAMPAANAAKTKSSGGGLPTIDLQKRCQRSSITVSEMMGDPNQKGQAFDTCMKSETEARDALQKAWSDMPAEYKSFCVIPAVYSPSYV